VAGQLVDEPAERVACRLDTADDEILEEPAELAIREPSPAALGFEHRE